MLIFVLSKFVLYMVAHVIRANTFAMVGVGVTVVVVVMLVVGIVEGTMQGRP